MKEILLGIAIIVVVGILILGWALCKAAALADRGMEWARREAEAKKLIAEASGIDEERRNA